MRFSLSVALCRWALLLAVVVATTMAHAQPYVRILSPAPGQCLPGPDVTVQFEAGGFPIAPGSNSLHFMLDNDPFQVQFDAHHPHTFKDVPPGTHTIRVYGADVMHQSIPGTLAVVTFSVGYPDTYNNYVPGTPLLTYNLPQGEYLGIDAADIAVDFMVTNAAPGHGYQVAYYVDGRRFLVQDMCGPRHLKKLAPGFHKIRVELQDMHGDLVPGPYNRTERTILVSPDQLRKSRPGEPDHYPASLPRIPSIKGAMTMGSPWLAHETEGRTLSPAQVSSQQSLTVRRDDEVISLDGTTRREFKVREGGTPDETVVMESRTTVEPVAPSVYLDTDTSTEEEADDETESLELREAEPDNEADIPRVPVRRVGTSPAPTLRATTGTLSQALRDKPQTTATLKVENANTTAATVTRRDGGTTAARVNRRDGETTRSRPRARTRPNDVTGTSTAVKED